MTAAADTAPGRLDLAGLVAVLAAGARPIPGWPGYLATSEGQILSVRRPGVARILAPYPHRSGHLKVELYRGEGRQRTKKEYVHRLVALAWHGPPPDDLDDPRVLHADHDPTDNRPANLTWGTRYENAADRERRRREGEGEGALLGDPWATHEHAQAVCGRMGVYLPDPRWGF